MADYEILLLDEGSPVFRTLAWILAYKGHQVTRATAPQVFQETLQAKDFDLIIAQLTSDRADELEVLKKAKKLNPQVLVMVLSGDHQMAFPLEAYAMEIDDYVLMPCPQAGLWRRVAACLERLASQRRKLSPERDLATINKRVHKKMLRMFSYFQDSLDCLAGDLGHLTQDSVNNKDKNVSKMLQKVSARVEVLKDMTEGFRHQIFRNLAISRPAASPGRN